MLSFCNTHKYTTKDHSSSIEKFKEINHQKLRVLNVSRSDLTSNLLNNSLQYSSYFTGFPNLEVKTFFSFFFFHLFL